jgi:inosine/xanthosine triphosphate pyrophosphatase family protein
LDDGTEKIFEGILEGKISTDLVGEPGRGYGRIFILDNGKSIAESNSTMVVRNDHRYQAMEKAVKYIKELI